YLDYVAAKGVGPPTEPALRGHFQNVLALQAAGPSTELGPQMPFESLRDGQAFDIHYGLPADALLAADSEPIIASEKRGADGSRIAVYASGRLECIDCE